MQNPNILLKVRRIPSWWWDDRTRKEENKIVLCSKSNPFPNSHRFSIVVAAVLTEVIQPFNSSVVGVALLPRCVRTSNLKAFQSLSKKIFALSLARVPIIMPLIWTIGSSISHVIDPVSSFLNMNRYPIFGSKI